MKHESTLLNLAVLLKTSLRNSLFLSLYFLIICCTGLKTAADGIADPNPNAFFQPRLNHVERRRTGIIVLSLTEIEQKPLINNPFLSSSRQKRDNFFPHKDYRLFLDTKEYLPDQRGKIHIENLKPQKYQLKIAHQSFELNLSLGETLLLLALYGQSQTRFNPPVIGITSLEILESREFTELQKKISSLLKLLSEVQFRQINPKILIPDDYRDQHGKKDDFAAYLCYLQNQMLTINFSEVRFFFRKEITNAEISGLIRWKDGRKSNFITSIQLNKDQQIIRHQTDSTGAAKPRADAED